MSIVSLMTSLLTKDCSNFQVFAAETQTHGRRLFEDVLYMLCDHMVGEVGVAFICYSCLSVRVFCDCYVIIRLKFT